jgi:multiple sugar transport system substrate-binding protein
MNKAQDAISARTGRSDQLPGGRGRGRRALTRREQLAGLAGGAPLLALSCGQAGTSQPSTVVSGPVTISAWFPVSGVFAPYLQSEVELFQQANQRVKVTVEGPGAEDKLQAAVIAGDPPDIQHSNYIPMFNWVRQNALEPIDPYLDRRGKADFHDWAREGSTVDGKMYEWPWMLNPTGVIVNRSLFAEKNAAHLLPKPGPKADWTIDQWRAALRAVTTITGDPERDVYGTAFLAGATGGDYWQMMYLWSSGAELYNRDQTRVTICTREGVAALQMLVDLVHRERVAAPGAERMIHQSHLDLFLKKRLGMMNGSPATVGDVERGLKDGTILPPFDAQFFPTPHAPGKRSIAFVAINSFLVFRQTKNADRTRGAMQLGFHLTDTAAQKTITPLGQLPVRKSVGNIYPDDQSRTTALASIETGRDMGRFPENGEIRKLWQLAAQAAFSSQKTPQEALDEMCRLSEPVMAKQTAR